MATSRPITALIVEDNQFVREVLKAMLSSRFPAVTIFEAEDLTDGHRQLSDHAPELVFLDICLPDGNGLDLAERIRQELPCCTVAVFTSYDLPEYRTAASRCGVAHFLAKDRMDAAAVSGVVEQAMERMAAS